MCILSTSLLKKVHFAGTRNFLLMKRGFLLGRAAQLASSTANELVASTANSAEQPASELRSIADVDGWLKANVATLSSCIEARRIKDVVEVLKPNLHRDRRWLKHSSSHGMCSRRPRRNAGHCIN